VALAYLARALRESGMPMIDCQQQTQHLRSLGARPIPRAAFAAQLRELVPRIEPAAIVWPNYVAGQKDLMDDFGYASLGANTRLTKPHQDKTHEQS
jgi:hypothetical protein